MNAQNVQIVPWNVPQEKDSLNIFFFASADFVRFTRPLDYFCAFSKWLQVLAADCVVSEIWVNRERTRREVLR